MEFLQDHWLEIALFLYAIGSEVMGLPKFKSNSIVQAVWRGVGKGLARKGVMIPMDK
jgi:hypothetical protein